MRVIAVKNWMLVTLTNENCSYLVGYGAVTVHQTFYGSQIRIVFSQALYYGSLSSQEPLKISGNGKAVKKERVHGGSGTTL